MNDARKILPNEEYGKLVIVPFGVFVEGGEILLCLNVQKIREVIDLDSYSPLPSVHRPFIGIYDYRLGPVPILDISLLLRCSKINFGSLLSKSDKEASVKRLIFCQLQNFVVGIVVDSTKRIEAAKNIDVLPLPQAMNIDGKNLFNGIIRYQGRLLYMLDLENILFDLGVTTISLPSIEEGNLLAGRTILVVEDSELFCKKIESIFSKQGARCEFARDGYSGYQTFLNDPFRFDLIFTDIEMPIMNGIEMVRKLKNSGQLSVPVIFNSSISNIALIKEVEKESLGLYLVKFNEESIIAKVMEAFNFHKIKK